MTSSLLFGVLFVPTHSVEAGIVSSISSLIIGDEALAQSEANILRPVLPGDSNSQNLSILQANVSSAVVLEKSTNSTSLSLLDSSTSNNIVSESALLPSVGVLGGTEGENIEASSEDISVYVVRKGDAISQIAKMFNVSTNTILWANDMKKGDVLKEGDILVILPIDGVKHVVEKGQTLKTIAKKYNADVADIASFNGISEDSALAVGDELIIPDGEIYVDGPAVNTGTKSNNKTTPAPTKNLAGYFINPAPGSTKTQGLHGKNAVDLAAPIGTRILAAASGKVLVARMGWNGGYGGMVIIQHSNGTKTLYSHLSSLSTNIGQDVSQGETIAYMGNTGRVRPSKGGTGSHLHFEVYGAKNPGADSSWKR